MNLGDFVAGTLKKLSGATMDLLKKKLIGEGKAAAVTYLTNLIYSKTGVNKTESRKVAVRIVNKTATDIRSRM